MTTSFEINSESTEIGTLGGEASVSFQSAQGKRIQHFWVSSYPFFESTLFIVPSPSESIDSTLSASERRCSAELFIYDSDGAEINKVKVEFPAGRVYILEVDPLLGSAKFESGLKHAHVVAHLNEGAAAFCRVHTRDAAAGIGESHQIDSTQATFFPLTISTDRANILCIVNQEATEATVRCRLFFGKRSPEASWTIPGNASRVVSIESEFAEYVGVEHGDQVQAYLRLTTKSGNLGVQLLERTDGPKETGFYTSVS